ncbi:MAG: phage major capsid protein [Bacteroidetes bacterium]|nr:phage major capsid protein [Bacteroidota bacterium]
MPLDVRKLREQIFFRDFRFQRSAVDAETRTVELALSSETPVERYYGTEILDHSKGSVDLSRMQDGAPLLCDHDPSDIVGVIESAQVDADRVLRVKARFGKSARAEEVFQDVLDGIRSKVSIGYQVNAWETTKGEKGGSDTFRMTNWTPMEGSIVAIPADATVGVGRGFTPPAVPAVTPQEDRMSGENTTPVAPTPTPAAPNHNIEELRSAAVVEALEVTSQADAMGFGKEARDFLSQGLKPADARVKIMGLMVEKARAGALRPAPLDSKIQEKFSIARAIMLSATGQRGFETEVSDDIAKKLNRQTSGIFVPTGLQLQGRAALDAHTTNAAKELVNVEPLTFIDILRNRTMVLALGATFLPGLVGTVPFVRQSTAGTATWTGDNPGSGTAASNPNTSLFNMTPKQLMALRSYSKMLLTQTSGVADTFVVNDLVKAHSLALDLAAINGSGASNQPLGILGTSGIGSVVGGANGLAPTHAHMVGLETAVATANADMGALAYLTNAKIRGELKLTASLGNTANIPVWTKDGVNGYRAEASNQVPANLTKGTSSGVCSAILFGNWNDLLIGEWGALDIITDPYSLADQGLIRVVSTQLADVNVRHPESFAAMVDAL